MAYQTLKLETSGAIATITLTRPEKRNAISNAMIEEVVSALGEVESSAARVLILTGSGKAFCSGMDLEDLKALSTQSYAEHLEDARRFARLYRDLWKLSIPSIAAVNGAAIAGGTCLATLCDFTLAVPEAKFGYPEVHIGFIPAIVSVFVTRQIGDKNARDLFLTGRIIDAAEAQRLGMITKIVPAQKLMDETQALAESLLAGSPTSLLVTKRLLCRLAAPDLDRDLELAIEESAQIRSTPDFREGLASFLEKRPPRWSPR